MRHILPYFVSGKVVKGYGRGSKTLGFPTANFEQDAVDNLPDALVKGIYYGWAQVEDNGVFPMVASVGWNPFFGNQIKSVETHILHNYRNDFYGSTLKICLAGYIRDEMNFESVDELKVAIRNDIEHAKRQLSTPEQEQYSKNPFFSMTNGTS